MTINQKRVLDEFFHLVQLPCPSGQERPAADYLIAHLKELGGEVIEDEKSKKANGDTGCLVANFSGAIKTAPTVLLLAHIDCVPNCIGIKPKLVDGVIKSDGTTILGSDDKSGVVAIMETLRCLKEQAIPHGDLQIVFTVGEEKGLVGSKNIDTSLLKADFGFALDSNGHPGTIIYSAPGQYNLLAKVYGKTAHGGVSPEKGVNAIKKAAFILTGIPTGRLDDETTCNIGTIKGGSATNIVPDLVEIAMDIRSRNTAKLEKLVERLQDSFRYEAAKVEAKIDVEAVRSYGPILLDRTSPCITLAKKAAEELGLKVDVAMTGGGSDASLLNTYGIPCPVLGTGMTNVHTAQEIIIEQDLYDIAEWTLAIVKKSASSSGR